MAQTMNAKGEHETRKPGRPRDSEIEASIKIAALELLELQGFANLTIEGVASRAGVGKATIYRWWPTKAHLIIDAFLEQTAFQISVKDSGSVREDVINQLRAISDLFGGAEGRIIASLISAAQQSEELKRVFREEWLARRRSVTLSTLERGQLNGQLRADVDLETLLDALVGPFYIALLMGHREMESINVEALVADVFVGVESPLS